MKEIINTENAPQPIGPYSQAVKASGSFIFISGQIPFLANGELAGEDIETQTKQSILNLKAILEAAGSDLEKVVKVNVYMKDMNDFVKMNTIYNTFFETSKPARAAVEVSRLPKDVLVEIEAVALID